MENKKELSSGQPALSADRREELLNTLKSRFEKNPLLLWNCQKGSISS